MSNEQNIQFEQLRKMLYLFQIIGMTTSIISIIIKISEKKRKRKSI